MSEEIAGWEIQFAGASLVSFITLIMSPLVMEVTYTDFLIEDSPVWPSRGHSRRTGGHRQHQ